MRAGLEKGGQGMRQDARCERRRAGGGSRCAARGAVHPPACAARGAPTQAATASGARRAAAGQRRAEPSRAEPSQAHRRTSVVESAADMSCRGMLLFRPGNTSGTRPACRGWMGGWRSSRAEPCNLPGIRRRLSSPASPPGRRPMRNATPASHTAAAQQAQPGQRRSGSAPQEQRPRAAAHVGSGVVEPERNRHSQHVRQRRGDPPDLRGRGRASGGWRRSRAGRAAAAAADERWRTTRSGVASPALVKRASASCTRRGSSAPRPQQPAREQASHTPWWTPAGQACGAQHSTTPPTCQHAQHSACSMSARPTRASKSRHAPWWSPAAQACGASSGWRCGGAATARSQRPEGSSTRREGGTLRVAALQ